MKVFIPTHTAEYGLVLHRDRGAGLADVLADVFGFSRSAAARIAARIVDTGRAIVFVGTAAECETMGRLVTDHGTGRTQFTVEPI